MTSGSPLRTKEEAQQDLEPAVPILIHAVRDSFAQFVREHSQMRHGYSKRTEANIVHDLIRARLIAELRDVPGWTTRMILKQLFLLEFEDKYRIKLKKLDPNLRSRNIPTQNVLDFMFQVVQPSLFPDATSLVLGYQLNVAETEVKSVWITCPNGEGRHWEWELAQQADVIVLPDREASTAERSQVRPKIQPKPATQVSDESRD